MSMGVSQNERDVFFTNARGQKLAGTLCGDVQHTMAISCHGMLSGRQGEKHRMLSRLLLARDVSTLRFDFAGRGDSEGALLELSYSNEKQDLCAAVDYLVGLGAEHFVVFGSSMGGAVALLWAAREERIIAVATLAAVGHPQEIEERYPQYIHKWRNQGFLDLPEGRIGYSFVEDALTHNVVSAVGVLRAPVFIVHGTEDQVIPVSDAHDIASAARNASLHVVDGADHRFSNPQHLRPAMGCIVDFLVQHAVRRMG